MKIAAVVDSACLIGLERIGRLDVLPALLDPVFVPPAVHHEFGSTPAWMKVELPADVGMVAALRLLVDPGESEAIVLAYEKGLRSYWMTAKHAKWPNVSACRSLAPWDSC